MKNQYLNQFTAYPQKLPLEFSVKVDSVAPAGSLVRLVCDVTEEANLLQFVDFSNRNSHGYDAAMMLKCVLLAFAINGYSSLRDLEDLCRNDIRFIYITDGLAPSFQSFHRFIHNDLTVSAEEIFAAFNKWLIRKDNIDTSVLCIDGTKMEANASKNSFVWINATRKFRIRAWKKALSALIRLNRWLSDHKETGRFSVLKEMDAAYLCAVCKETEKICTRKGIVFRYGRGHGKPEIQRIYEEIRKAGCDLLRYDMHMEIAEGRNSFSKTDIDATFMHMKYDYYNHTNVFKPGYNVQFGISDGYILNVYTNSDGNDVHSYIPFMEKYYRMYGRYPKYTPADAGYGSYDNYYYCRLHDINLSMKYSGYEKRKEKITDRNRFKSWAFIKTDGSVVCPAGHEFRTEKIRIERRGIYPRIVETMGCSFCGSCPMRTQCTKSSGGRKIARTARLERWKQEVDTFMATKTGRELMQERQVYSEGKFGDMKKNWEYDRLQRRGKNNVQTELILVAIGLNLRRYLRRQAEKAVQSAASGRA